VRTEDTIYLVKVSTKLADRIENYDEDDIIDEPVDDLDALKELDIADDDADDDDDVEKDADADVDTERDPDDEDDDVDADGDIADEEDEDEEEY
ncbi:MAG: DNA primase, partial [Flavobacterium sp.]